MSRNYRNPVVLRDGRIDCEVEHPLHGWIPFTADPNDSEEEGRELFARLKALPDHAKARQPAETGEELAAKVRMERDRRLAGDVDPIAGNALRWADLTATQQGALSQYRRDLLDISKQTGFPQRVTWPTPPDFITQSRGNNGR